MSARRFYLTLPSNSSMGYYPSNTVAQFTTKLPQVIELDGDWEVALTEISVPSPLPNALRDTHFVTLSSRNTDEKRTYSLPSGYYEDVQAAAGKLNTMMFTSGVAFRYQMKRVKLVISGSYDVEFSEALAQMLGYSSRERYRARSIPHTASRPVDLSSVNIPTMYLYCDVLKHIVVGDIMAPLLRVVNMESTKKPAMHQIMNPPLYVPLHKKNFDTIEINIMTDTGKPVPFTDGKSVAVLEFKRVGLL